MIMDAVRSYRRFLPVVLLLLSWNKSMPAAVTSGSDASNWNAFGQSAPSLRMPEIPAVLVLVKGDVRTLPAVPAAGRDDAAFPAAVEANVAMDSTFGNPLDLSDLPQWGRQVAGAAGTIQFRDSLQGGVIVRVSLSGLSAGHRYLLTLNGNPEREGNDRLADPVPGNPAERYVDFHSMSTDSMGRFEAVLSIRLAAGSYDVRFYVKDTDDYKIVLYRDFFRFVVE
jgi:hypothetical protein